MLATQIDLNETTQEEFGFGRDVLRTVRAWTLIEIRDTRTLDDARKPISGTGDALECACCGRLIEVHATVSHRVSGHQAVVGTQCCKKAKMKYGEVEPTNKNYWKRDYRKSWGMK
jgi:hypothetical protein